MTRALVLGSTGRLGRIMRRVWTTPPDAFSSLHWIARKPEPGVTAWQPGDPTGALPRADVIIALWGVTAGDEEALALNSTLATTAMDLALDLGASRVLHCSSAAVYPGTSDPLEETDDTDPPRPYGAAKLAMEEAVQAWVQDHPNGSMTCLMRLANVAGADSLFASLDRGGPVTLDQFADDHGPQRSYLAPQDFARALIDLSTCPDRYFPPVVNLAGPRPVAMEAIVRAAERQVIWQPAPDNALQCVSLDTGRITRLSGELVASSDAGSLVANWRDWGETRQ